MAQPYVGEIRMFAGNFAPAGWEFCEGQVLPIDENEVLFQLIGTTYGGDGQSTFALPDLRGRLPMHWGSGVNLAEAAGVEEVTLSGQQVPLHTHALLANSGPGSDAVPTNNVMAGSPNLNMLREATPGVALSPLAVGPVGGSQPHTNFQPYLCVDFIIALFGIYPSPT
jgi:microcystin-dependent protein